MVSLGNLAKSLFGSANERQLRKYRQKVDQINALEPELEALSDEDLRARTAEFREELENGATLDDLLVPAFATVREAAKRTLGQRHFDVQLIGGMKDRSLLSRVTLDVKTLKPFDSEFTVPPVKGARKLTPQDVPDNLDRVEL